MGFFDFLLGADINKGIEEYSGTKGAVLLDVRTGEEYREGHIKGSVNIPLDRLDAVGGKVSEKDTPIFTYCHSGARSMQAASYLERLGYTNVKNIGGIARYTGALE